jgi:hypothetical protein
MLGKRLYHLMVSIIVGIFILVIFLGVVHRAQASVAQKTQDTIAVEVQTLTGTQQTIFLPIAMKYYPWNNPFGVESTIPIVPGSFVFSNTVNLPAEWVRLNGRISWRFLQSEEGGPIQWELLANFEDELRYIRGAGITPIVIVDDYPRWATDNTVRGDGKPTSCGRLLEDKVDDFAVFVTELVNRYKTPEFGVRNWELGNEPDVDPNIVAPDNVFGCWGEVTDPYYGGEAYGRMVIQVGSAIKAADPMARVWIGGLLLDKPKETDSEKGHPELFLEGILRSGAAPYFDIVPYHLYPGYGWQTVRDFDLLPLPWSEWGGGTVGKARYLRQLMQAYDVSKPLFLNETSFICAYDPIYPDRYPWCKIPGEDFYELQASFVVRSATRAYNENIAGYIWYTMNGPGWRWGGLLDTLQSPKPVYWAYSYMISQFRNSRVLGPVSYATGVEAYAFDLGSNRLDVLWSIYNDTITVTVPMSDWIGSFGRNGEVITPTVSGTNYLIPVGFSPVYLQRRP